MAFRQWPNPQDTQLDRSRLIGCAYREIALRAAPEECQRLDGINEEFGEIWMLDVSEPSGEYWSREEVAAIAEVKPDTVSSWTTRGYLTRFPEGYVPSQVKEFLEDRPKRRSIKNSHQLDL